MARTKSPTQVKKQSKKHRDFVEAVLAAAPGEAPDLSAKALDQLEEAASRADTGRAASEPPKSYPHVEKALQYARDVVSGKVNACKWVRLACKRQLKDLDDRKDGVLRNLFVWDENQASRVCRFIECLPHVKGPKAKNNELIVLEGWQCFILTTVFGWRRLDTGGRRFRRAYTEVPRGNAKSTLSSGIGLYGLCEDGEEGAEVYSAATTRDQAKIVQGDAQAMMRKRADFAARLGIIVNQYILLHPRSNSKFEALSRESGTMDGKNVHIAIVDELHAHKDRGVYDVIETATAKRLASLIWIITTAGSDSSGICYEVRTYVTKVLEGLVEDDTQFGIIYTLDEGDDWTDPEMWIKANPNWGVSVMPEVFAALAKKAMQVLSAQNNFKTKHLNLWVNADVAWMDMNAWDKCVDPTLDPEQFTNQQCIDALDLASKIDIAAKARLFWKDLPRPEGSFDPKRCEHCNKKLEQHPKPDELVAGRMPSSTTCTTEKFMPMKPTERHYYGFLNCYLPETALIDGRNSQYEGWAEGGYIQTTPGDVLDFAVIKEDILDDTQKFAVREMAYDPWQATQLAQELAGSGMTVVEVRATVQNFSAAMKEFDALVRAGRWHTPDNPLFRWMITNVVCHYDAKDNVFPRKERPENKIDGPVAMIMALFRAMAIVDEVEPYSPERGVRFL